MELNPNNPTTQLLHDNWHKVLAVLINKFKLGDVEITIKDLQDLENAYPGGMPTIVADGRFGKFVIKLRTEAEARVLMNAQ